VFEPASPGPSNGGKSRHAALRARDRGRKYCGRAGFSNAQKPFRFAYGLCLLRDAPVGGLGHASSRAARLLSLIPAGGAASGLVGAAVTDHPALPEFCRLWSTLAARWAYPVCRADDSTTNWWGCWRAEAITR